MLGRCGAERPNVPGFWQGFEPVWQIGAQNTLHVFAFAGDDEEIAAAHLHLRRHEMRQRVKRLGLRHAVQVDAGVDIDIALAHITLGIAV